MKKYTVLLLITALVLSLLSGCRMGGNQDTTANTNSETLSTEQTYESSVGTGDAQTGCAQILSGIWDTYAEDERFAAYGGTIESSVDGAPGDLDMQNTDELTTKYMIPETQLAALEEGASLVHLMNSNIFTAAAFRIQSGTDTTALAKSIRENIQRTQWICGSPDKLLIAMPEADFLLISFGSDDAMQTFQTKLNQVYSDAQILYSEAIVS